MTWGRTQRRWCGGTSEAERTAEALQPDRYPHAEPAPWLQDGDCEDFGRDRLPALAADQDADKGAEQEAGPAEQQRAATGAGTEEVARTARAQCRTGRTPCQQPDQRASAGVAVAAQTRFDAGDTGSGECDRRSIRPRPDAQRVMVLGHEHSDDGAPAGRERE